MKNLFIAIFMSLICTSNFAQEIPQGKWSVDTLRCENGSNPILPSYFNKNSLEKMTVTFSSEEEIVSIPVAVDGLDCMFHLKYKYKLADNKLTTDSTYQMSICESSWETKQDNLPGIVSIAVISERELRITEENTDICPKSSSTMTLKKFK